jgi:hypothetical protein
VIVGFVAYLAVTRKDVQPGETAQASRAPAARHRR